MGAGARTSVHLLAYLAPLRRRLGALHGWAHNGATTNYRITRIISIPPKTTQEFWEVLGDSWVVLGGIENVLEKSM